MGEHLSEERFLGWVRRTLPAAELLAADDHLAACEACRTRLPDAGPALAELRASIGERDAVEHLAYETLADWVDGALPGADAEIAGEHLEACARCAAEAAELRAVRNEIVPAREYAPARRLVVVPLTRSPLWLQIAAVLALVVLGFWALPHPAPQETAASPSPRLPQAKPILLADSGRRIGIDPAGRVTGLEAFERETQERVARALASGRLQAADLSDIRGRREQLMGDTPRPAAFRLEAPVGIVVESAEPILRWQPLPGASVYRVIVLDADLTPVVESADLAQHEWTPTRPLERGRTYVWQVSAEKGDRRFLAPTPPDPEARFRVMDATHALLLAAARARGESHVVLAVLYAESGLLDEATRELQALGDSNPGSPLVASLRQSLVVAAGH